MPIHDWTRMPGNVFRSFHASWVNRTSDALNSGLLPPDLYSITERVEGDVSPDLLFLPDYSEKNEASPVRKRSTTPPAARFQFSTPGDRTTRRLRVAVCQAEGDRCLARVEVVLPGHKASRHALRSFVADAVGAIEAGIGLVIVDVWPLTPRDPAGIHGAIWKEIDESQVYVPPEDKPLTVACDVRDPERMAFVEPAAVGDPLPNVPLFLDAENYVQVPLEVAYLEAFAGMPRRFRQVLEAP